MTERILNRLQNNATRRKQESLKRDVTRLQGGAAATALDAALQVRQLDRETSVPNTPMALLDVRRISRRIPAPAVIEG